MRAEERVISALGLAAAGQGGFVRNYHTVVGPDGARLICADFVLLTSAAPRREIDGAERLLFHHGGGTLRVDGELLGPPLGYQVCLAGGGGRVIELVSGAWALISEVVAGGAAAASLRAGAPRGGEDAGLIAALGLRPHVEGGYFGERWRSGESVETGRGRRSVGSTIYYLLTADSPVGRFHRNASDITHFYHAGGPIEYATISEAGEWREVVLGMDLAAGQVPAFTCPGGWWKSSRIAGEFGLISEVVAPGFDWADQEMAAVAGFERVYPQHRGRWLGRV